MVFWKTYPFQHIIETLWNRETFLSQLIEKDPIPSPTGRTAQLVDRDNRALLTTIRRFLQTHFGSPPHTPVLDIPEDILLGPNDHIFVLRDEGDELVGTIRYHYMGEAQESIYVVDAFCIHPAWRRKGLGDYLLTELHRYANQIGIPYAMFLKEGPSVSTLAPPFYTGTYVYRALHRTVVCPNLMELTVEEAHRMMRAYQTVLPNRMMIWNKSANQRWRWYRRGNQSIMICIQDTYQRKEGKKIAWVTAWLESPNTTDEIRREAATAVAEDLYPAFDYVWMNQVWVGGSEEWSVDGPFHWYSYQWSTSITGHSYALPM
jgi:GNAT superfamily N-acetyltransferase